MRKLRTAIPQSMTISTAPTYHTDYAELDNLSQWLVQRV